MDCPREDTLLAWCEGQLPPEQLPPLEAHAAACDRCRRTRVELARLQCSALRGERAQDLLPQGSRVGRYLLLEWLGEGAMGRVYSAFDPVLDRRVAIKLIHPWRAGTGDDAHARLLAEAQALARVVHPNLVAAFDAGAYGDSVFLAMELVEGQTLRQWLAAAPRTTAQVLEVFLHAGRGLAAAHAAGLIHRDFKPENVLVGQDGRARVADMGLARAASALGDERAGTPAYMAPEQLAGAPLDARVDQFAFCVALHEALCGKRPFTLATLEATSGGPPPLTGVKLPARALKAVARGLAADPAARFPDLPALLEALTPRPSRARRVAAAAALASLTLGLGLLYGSWRPASLCEGGPARLQTAWSEQRAAQLAAHFAPLDAAAQESGRLLSDKLQAYGARWTARYQEACEATRVWGHQSDAVLTARMQCLQRRLVELDAVAQAALATDAKSARSAVEAAGTLSPLQVCDASAELLAENPPPENPARAKAVEALEALLARASALKGLGEPKQGLPLTREVMERARALQHAPTLARAAVLQGELQEQAGDAAAAEGTLKDAYLLASESKDDRALTRAAIGLANATSALSRLDDAERWAWQARAALARAGNVPELAAALANQEGHLAYSRADFAAARRLYGLARARWESVYGPKDATAAVALANQAQVEVAEDQLEAALPLAREAVAVFSAALGPAHPKAAHARIVVAGVLQNQGRNEEAVAEAEVALRMLAPLGPEHPLSARALLTAATSLQALGQAQEALDKALAAADTFGRAMNTLLVGQALLTAAQAQGDLHRVTEALATLQRARALHLQVFGAEHPELASVDELEGEVLLQARQPAQALLRFQRALALREKVSGAAHVENAIALSGVGQALLALHRPAQAVAPLTRARALLQEGKILPELLATTEQALARAR